jgi:hypothetical protein
MKRSGKLADGSTVVVGMRNALVMLLKSRSSRVWL